MNKILKLLFPIILLPTITACQDKAHSVIAINAINSDSAFIEVSVDQLGSLIDSKQQFILEMYTTTCSHCKDLEVLLRSYVQKTGKAIYRLQADGVEREELYAKVLDKYPEIFPERYVPTIKYIKDGVLTYNVNSNKFGTYNGLSKILNNHFLSSNIFIANSLEEYESFAGNNGNHLIFSYDMDTKSSLEFANQYLVSSDFVKTKKTAILVNKSTFADKFADFCTKYTDGNEKFFSAIKDGEIVKTIDYTSADGNQINELISIP